MTGSPKTSQQSNYRGLRHHFVVHLLKITRLPSYSSSSIGDVAPHKGARKDALKVTALFNSQQVALGDFPVSVNECVIDRKLSCQFIISKSGAHSKLHLYIDQTCSSGLAGHLALDLQEFIREDETEIYLKYPLYANTSHHSRGPVLKILVQNLGKSGVEATVGEDNEIVLLPHPDIERLCSSSASEKPSCITQELNSSSQLDMSGRDQGCHLDEEASLLQLEGAISDIGEKLKALVSAFKTRDNFQNGDYLVPDMECPSSITSPLLSSLHTGTSLDSYSEIFEEQCADWEELLGASFDLGSSTDNPHSFANHARSWSDISAHTRNLQYPRVLKSGKNTSTEESPESWCTQSSTENGNHKNHCRDECFMCSSAHGLRSYEGLQASLSARRSKSFSARPTTPVLQDREAALAELRAPVEQQQHSKEDNGVDTPVSGKRPGLLKSLFGAVVVAGVSLLGARNSNVTRIRAQPMGSQSSQSKRLGRDSRSSFSYDIRNERSIRNRYTFRR